MTSVNQAISVHARKRLIDTAVQRLIECVTQARPIRAKPHATHLGEHVSPAAGHKLLGAAQKLFPADLVLVGTFF